MGGASSFCLRRRSRDAGDLVWRCACGRAADPPRCSGLCLCAYPTVTVINIADVLDTIQGFIGQITQVVRFLAGFSMLSGVVILASSVASTRYRRIREVVVLKTIGATRGRDCGRSSAWSLFFLGIAVGGGRCDLCEFADEGAAASAGCAVSSGLAGGVGRLGFERGIGDGDGMGRECADFKGQKPLQVLREE